MYPSHSPQSSWFLSASMNTVCLNNSKMVVTGALSSLIRSLQWMTKSPSPSSWLSILTSPGHVTVPHSPPHHCPLCFLRIKVHNHSKTSLTRTSKELHLRCCRRLFRKLHCTQFYSDFAFIFLEIQNVRNAWYHFQLWLRIFCHFPNGFPQSMHKYFYSKNSQVIYTTGSWKKLSKRVKKKICQKNKNNMSTAPLVALPIGFWFFSFDFSFLRYLVW